MTATEELRRMLDERGVEWDELIGHPVVVGTEWHDSDGYPCTALEHADDVPDGMLSVQANFTPEQAIEATLGRGTCHPVANDNLNESEGTGDAWANCSECGYLLCVLTDPSSPMPNYCPSCGRKVVDDASVG